MMESPKVLKRMQGLIKKDEESALLRVENFLSKQIIEISRYREPNKMKSSFYILKKIKTILQHSENYSQCKAKEMLYDFCHGLALTIDYAEEREEALFSIASKYYSLYLSHYLSEFSKNYLAKSLDLFEEALNHAEGMLIPYEKCNATMKVLRFLGEISLHPLSKNEMLYAEVYGKFKSLLPKIKELRNLYYRDKCLLRFSFHLIRLASLLYSHDKQMQLYLLAGHSISKVSSEYYGEKAMEKLLSKIHRSSKIWHENKKIKFEDFFSKCLPKGKKFKHPKIKHRRRKLKYH